MSFFEKKNPVVVGLGEILWDVFPDRKRLGGAPANFAYHAARQGFDGVVVSAIGDDALGREIENVLAEKKLPALLPRRASATGRVTISLDAAGVASYVFAENCAWDDLPFTAETERLARRASAVCFGSLAQRDARSRASIARFLENVPADAVRVFDVNLRQNFFTEKILADSLAHATILKVNEDELPVLASACGLAKNVSQEKFFDGVFEKNSALGIVVLTLGKSGSAVAARDGTRSFVAADASVEVVDTVGAGDSFTAGFVCALLAGRDVRAAHYHASALANFVCSRAGAMPEIPDALKICA